MYLKEIINFKFTAPALTLSYFTWTNIILLHVFPPSSCNSSPASINSLHPHVYEMLVSL